MTQVGFEARYPVSELESVQLPSLLFHASSSVIKTWLQASHQVLTVPSSASTTTRIGSTCFHVTASNSWVCLFAAVDCNLSNLKLLITTHAILLCLAAGTSARQPSSTIDVRTSAAAAVSRWNRQIDVKVGVVAHCVLYLLIVSVRFLRQSSAHESFKAAHWHS
jgi:hypothetical protein